MDLVNGLLNLQQQLKHTSLEIHIDDLLQQLSIEKDQTYLREAEAHLKQSLKQMVNYNEFLKQIQIALSSCESVY